MKTLVLGLGNPILSDNGVGIHVARELKGRLDQQGVTVMETSVAGLGLLDLLVGCDRAIIIDAIRGTEAEAGQIYRLEPRAFDDTYCASTPHDVNFATALEMGNKLGLPLPQKIVIFAIQVEDVTTFSEMCTPKVAQVIPTVADMVIQELNGRRNARAFYRSNHPKNSVSRTC